MRLGGGSNYDLSHSALLFSMLLRIVVYPVLSLVPIVAVQAIVVTRLLQKIVFIL